MLPSWAGLCAGDEKTHWRGYCLLDEDDGAGVAGAVATAAGAEVVLSVAGLDLESELAVLLATSPEDLGLALP